jgi:hypothetical protein
LNDTRDRHGELEVTTGAQLQIRRPVSGSTRIFAQATSPQKIMARRRKNRTHLKGPATQSTSNTSNDGSPKSFIIKHGQVGSSLTQLVRDMRKVMEPNTASRLKVSPTLIHLGYYCNRLIGGERNAIGIN